MARARGAPRPALLGIGGAIAIAIACACACACAAGVPVPELQHASGAALVFADAPAGRVRGRVVETLSSRGLFAEAYRGIPFAAAPTGTRGVPAAQRGRACLKSELRGPTWTPALAERAWYPLRGVAPQGGVVLAS